MIQPRLSLHDGKLLNDKWHRLEIWYGSVVKIAMQVELEKKSKKLEKVIFFTFAMPELLNNRHLML